MFYIYLFAFSNSTSSLIEIDLFAPYQILSLILYILYYKSHIRILKNVIKVQYSIRKLSLTRLKIICNPIQSSKKDEFCISGYCTYCRCTLSHRNASAWHRMAPPLHRLSIHVLNNYTRPPPRTQSQ